MRSGICEVFSSGFFCSFRNRQLHRAPSIPDLLIAATAERAQLTVLHLDKDFELIAGITGQAVERLE